MTYFLLLSNNNLWKGWGVSTIIGVAAAGQEISTRPFQLVTGRKWQGSAFGGVKGKTDLPGYVEQVNEVERDSRIDVLTLVGIFTPRFIQYLHQNFINVDGYVTHNATLSDISKGMDFMKSGDCIRCKFLLPSVGK